MGGSPEYAPKALFDLFDLIKQRIPSALLGGIQGDASHYYGYHRARNVLPSNDYSVTERLDRQGDGWACSALDVTLGSGDLMHTVSRRLLDAKNDKRMAPVREFFGSVDGRTVCGWDWSGNCATTSDDMSHLWHVHLSIHRKYANDLTALAPIADVLAGQPTNQEDDVSAQDVLDALASDKGKALLRSAIMDAPLSREPKDPKYRVSSWWTLASVQAGSASTSAKAAAASAAAATALVTELGKRVASLQAANDAQSKQIAALSAQVADLASGKVNVSGSIPATLVIGAQ